MSATNFNNRNIKARKLSPRDQEMLDLLLTAVNGSVDSRMLVDKDGQRTVYDTNRVLEAFAMAARGTAAQLLESVVKRGGKLGQYKLTTFRADRTLDTDPV